MKKKKLSKTNFAYREREREDASRCLACINFLTLESFSFSSHAKPNAISICIHNKRLQREIMERERDLRERQERNTKKGARKHATLILSLSLSLGAVYNYTHRQMKDAK